MPLNAMDRFGRISRFIGQMARYQWFARWFVRDLFRKYRRRALYISFGNFLGVSGQVAAFGLAYLYARAIESGVVLQYFGYSIVPGDSMAGLLVMVLTATLLLSVSAFLTWHARVLSNDLARRYADDCARRAFVLASSIAVCDDCKQAEALNLDRLNKYASRDARYSGLSARLLLNGLDGILGTFAGATALVYFDVVTSLLIAAILTVAAIFYYRISLKGADARRLLERKARQSGRERFRLSHRVQNMASAIEANDRELIEVFERGATYSAGLAFARARNVIATSGFITNLAAAASVFVVFLFVGLSAFKAQSGWTELIAYLVVLKYFTSKMTTAARVIVSINRFYPAIREYATFVAVGDRLRSQSKSGTREVAALILNQKPLSGAGDSLMIQRGDRCWLASPSKMSRSQALTLLGGLTTKKGNAESARLPSVWFICSEIGPSASGFREFFGLPKELTAPQLRAQLDKFGIGKEVTLPKDLDVPFDAGVLRRVGKAGVGAISLIAAAASAADVIMIETSLLDAIGSTGAEMALAQLSERIVLLTTADMIRLEKRYHIKAAVFFDGKQIIGWLPASALPLDSELVAGLAPKFSCARKRIDLMGGGELDEEMLG